MTKGFESTHLGRLVEGAAVRPSDPFVTLTEQLILSRASAMARAGHYASAEALLSSLIHRDEGPMPALDLMARVHAQQGRMLEAHRLWDKLLRLDPSNECYQRALRLAGDGVRWSLWGRIAKPALVVVTILLLFLAIDGVKNAFSSRTKDAVAALPPPVEAISVPAPPPPIEVPAVPGVIQHQEGSFTVLRFENGLFLRGATLTSDAKEVLATLGHQIEPLKGRTELTITGHTDSIPVPPRRKFADNQELAIARAAAVVRFLGSTTAIPIQVWSIRPSPEGKAPFANDGESHLRNRTVEIRVLAKLE